MLFPRRKQSETMCVGGQGDKRKTHRDTQRIQMSETEARTHRYRERETRRDRKTKRGRKRSPSVFTLLAV